jgi:hypothetical protein
MAGDGRWDTPTQCIIYFLILFFVRVCTPLDSFAIVSFLPSSIRVCVFVKFLDGNLSM